MRVTSTGLLMSPHLGVTPEELLPNSLALLPLRTPLPGELIHLSRDKVVFSPTSLQLDLEELEEQLASLPAALPPLPFVVVGQLCLGRFREDCAWYRARVDEVRQDGVVAVTYFDYGNSEDTRMEELAEVPEHLARPGPATVEVELSAAGEAWGEGGVLWLEEGAAGRRARLQPPRPVAAPESTTPPAGQPVKPPASRSAKSGPAVIEERVEVSVAQVDASGWAWVVTRRGDWQDVTAQLAHLQGTMEPAKVAEQGALVAAVYTEDGLLYRARVMVLENRMAEVMFVDFGNRDVVRADELLALPAELAVVPDLAARVRVAGVGEQEVTEALEEQLYREDLRMEMNQAGQAVFFAGGEELDMAALQGRAAGIEGETGAKDEQGQDDEVEVMTKAVPKSMPSTDRVKKGDSKEKEGIKETKVVKMKVSTKPAEVKKAAEVAGVKSSKTPGPKGEPEANNLKLASKSKKVLPKKEATVKSKELHVKNEPVVKSKEPVVKKKETSVPIKEATEELPSLIKDKAPQDAIKELKARMEEEIAAKGKLLRRRERATFQPTATLTQGMMDTWIQSCLDMLASRRGRMAGKENLVDKVADQFMDTVADKLAKELEATVMGRSGDSASSFREAPPALASLGSSAAGLRSLEEQLARGEEEKRGLLRHLEEERTLLELLQSDAGAAVASALARHAGPTTLAALEEVLVGRVVALGLVPATAAFLQVLVEEHGASPHLALLVQAVLAPAAMERLVYSESGSLVVVAALQAAEASDLAAGLWAEQELPGLLASGPGTGVARALLGLLTSRAAGAACSRSRLVARCGGARSPTLQLKTLLSRYWETSS